MAGNTTDFRHKCDRFKMEGWLYPALLKYFLTAPREIT
jgi:hypothetical protein